MGVYGYNRRKHNHQQQKDCNCRVFAACYTSVSWQQNPNLNMNLNILSAIIACCSVLGDFVAADTREAKFHIDGQVKVKVADADGDKNWIQQARILVDDGHHIGILKWAFYLVSAKAGEVLNLVNCLFVYLFVRMSACLLFCFFFLFVTLKVRLSDHRAVFCSPL